MCGAAVLTAARVSWLEGAGARAHACAARSGQAPAPQRDNNLRHVPLNSGLKNGFLQL